MLLFFLVEKVMRLFDQMFDALTDNQVDLMEFIDWSSVECLNQNSSHSLPNALKQVVLY